MCTKRISYFKAAATVLAMLLLCSCGNNIQTPILNGGEIRAMWLSCYELDFKDKSEHGFTESIESIFLKLKNDGFNTVFVHARSHCDAYYKSEIFPVSAYIAGEQGAVIDYDPLQIMIDIAKKFELKIHAWVNPFRVSSNTDISAICEENPAVSMYDKNDNSVVICNQGIYLNPSDTAARKLVLNGIDELLAYDIDGIHIDDYFYPTTDPSFDKPEYTEYCEKAKSHLSLDDWRRKNVDIAVSSIYRKVHLKNKIFSISPQANVQSNYDTMYADVEKWCSTEGYTDIIIPQIYFGFEYELVYKNQSMQFEKCASYWAELASKSDIQICYGLGLYRAGESVELNGEENTEWCENSDILSRQYKYCKALAEYNGVAVFSYSSSETEAGKSEYNNLCNCFTE